MLLKKISLKNIRSYQELEISFKEGITLLAGDIGSGKTTILLSIEFALLGLHSDITGSTLLRHGAQLGEVKLTLEINEEEITILRTLKRTNQTIKQESGYIETKQGRLELTPRELKTKILEILGYPKDLADKNKDIIYRYTVYTPQEETKSILYEKDEERIEKIRKIFNIDKYKTIKQNSILLSKAIKSENNYLYAKIENYDELILELKKEEEQVQNLELEQKELETKITKQQTKTTKAIEEYEEELKKYNEYNIKKENKNKIEKEIQETKTKIQQKQRKIDEITIELQQKIEVILTPPKKTDYQEKIKETKEKIIIIQEKIRKIQNSIAVYKSQLTKSQETSKKINDLEICQTCKQPIKKEHKEHVKKEEQQNINEITNKIKNITELETKATKILQKKQEELENINKEQQKEQKKEYEYKLQEQQLKIRKQKEETKEENKKEIQTLQQKITQLQEELKLINIEYDLNKITTQTQKKKQEEETLQNLKKQETITQVNITNKKENITKTKKQIENNLIYQKKYSKNKITENWIDTHFINLIDNIEKHALSQVYNEFNERFKTWFDVLLEQDIITAELDENFKPQITQNGFDTEINNLSGGEKTALALAYRLALNKTINDYVSNINTKNIIILDEPTDGFSSDQLDKLRDVLETLNMKQIIIVSHEPKLESMSEHILKVTKQEHDSQII